MFRFHRFVQGSQGWTIEESAVQFASPYLEVHRLKLTSPTRSEPFFWTLCHRKGAVVVAPLTPDNRFVLVRQERAPVRTALWEFPAGQIDDSEEPEAIRSTGLRELREEAGYELAPAPLGELISLGYFFPSPGFTDEHSHLLLARGVVVSDHGPEPDANEAFVDRRTFSGAELKRLIAEGEIRDANTLAAFARLTALDLLPT
jgi:ADP-ribose pyrophosphatase